MRTRQLGFFAVLLAVVSGCSSARPAPNSRNGLFGDLESRSGGPSRSVASRSASQNSELISSSEEESKIAEAEHGLMWPLKDVEVTSQFGFRGGDAHEGVDLRAKVGTPVFASQSGTVAYAGDKIRGYGKMLVIRHANNLATVYAHNSELKVRKGQKVLKGSLIAHSGESGNVTGPHLHYEVRYGLKSLNPQKIGLLAHKIVDTDTAQKIAETTPEHSVSKPVHRRRAKARIQKKVAAKNSQRRKLAATHKHRSL